MKRLIVMLFGVFFVMVLHSQDLTVKKLEKEWRVYYQMGCKNLEKEKFENAEAEIQKSLDLLRDNGAQNTNSYIYSLLKLAEIYSENGNAEMLKVVDGQIIQMVKSLNPNSVRYLNYMYCLAIYYSNTLQYKKAIETIDQALGEKELVSKNVEYKYKLIHRKALCFYCMGNLKEAIATERLIVNVASPNSPDFLQSFIYYLYKNNDSKEMDRWLQKCFDVSREPVLWQFAFSKASERASYWAKKGSFFTEYLPLYVSGHNSETLTSVCYDAALLSKGVLLAATNKTSDLILNSGDQSLVDSYSRYLSLKGKKEKNIDEDFELQALNDVFIKYQKEHKDAYKDDFRIGWETVRSKLQDADLAIEFICIRQDDGNNEYAALTLKKGYTAPHYIKLCLDKDISQISPNNIYVSSDLYDLIWKPLEKEMEGVDNIFFSPIGDFYQIGIEYLPNEDGMSMNNLYAIYRLSSTKELAKRNLNNPSRKVALFGGINYNASLEKMGRLSSNVLQEEVKSRPIDIESINVRALEVGGKISYLPGTLKEVNGIKEVLDKSKGCNIFLCCGDEGTETNFKGVSNKDCSVIHIATHGFFYKQNEKQAVHNLDKRFKNLNLHFVSDDIQQIDEDKMLTRSGLIFAGADNVINKVTIPQDVDDGILYADEISSLNLSNVNLVVLSACQSGLGNIANSEGVFGLQRGFKLAGAHSIIMSLWKVDDTATQKLMTQFYKYVVSGMKYSEALAEAQNVLRLEENGKYDAPRYWAAFVLLDGI